MSWRSVAADVDICSVTRCGDEIIVMTLCVIVYVINEMWAVACVLFSSGGADSCCSFSLSSSFSHHERHRHGQTQREHQPGQAGRQLQTGKSHLQHLDAMV